MPIEKKSNGGNPPPASFEEPAIQAQQAAPAEHFVTGMSAGFDDSENASPQFAFALPADLEALKETVMAEIAKLRAIVEALPSVKKEGIYASALGSVNCPECGLRIDGGSPTAAQGTLYEHPFPGTAKLGWAPCKYKGRKFKAPVVFLEFTEEVPKRLAS